MHAPRGRFLLGLTVILAMAVTLIAATGVLAALPPVLAFALLYCGRYPGSARLDRLIAARRARAARPRLRPARPLRPIFVLGSRGGDLIANSLAKRPPPRLAAST